MRSLKAITRSSFCLSRKRFKPPLEITQELLEVVKLYVREWGINRKELAKKLKITIGELEELERDNPILKQTIKEAKKHLEEADNYFIEVGLKVFTLKSRLRRKKQDELSRKRHNQLNKDLEELDKELLQIENDYEIKKKKRDEEIKKVEEEIMKRANI